MRRDKPTRSAEKLEKAMFCQSCGQQNRSDARWCDRCGAPFSQGGQAGTVPPKSQFSTQNAGPGGLGWQSSTTINQPLPVSMPQRPAVSTPPTAPITPPIQSGRRDGIVGIARNIQRSTEQVRYMGGSQGGNQQTTIQILRFVLEQYDRSGNRTKVLSVEMRGLSIFGGINEGDRVRVFGKSEGGLILTEQIQNLTTDSPVKAKGISPAMKVLYVIYGVFAVVFFAFVLYAFVSILVMHQTPFGLP